MRIFRSPGIGSVGSSVAMMIDACRYCKGREEIPAWVESSLESKRRRPVTDDSRSEERSQCGAEKWAQIRQSATPPSVIGHTRGISPSLNPLSLVFMSIHVRAQVHDSPGCYQKRLS
jgi:hypothetical protein